jgi:branched-chain amino acid transport system ATP-binding protein
MSAREAAVATIRDEHLKLTTVVEALHRLLADVATQHAEPDFALFSAALYYIADFPERCHHPKEDEYIFRALRWRTAEFNAVLDELQAEHISGTQSLNQLQCALVHYQGGARDGLGRFRTAVDAYSAMLSEHMRKEENLLAQARDCLTEEDWSRIAAAFEANEDPLFGGNRREEFRRLYHRIINLLPRRMKMDAQRAHLEQ